MIFEYRENDFTFETSGRNSNEQSQFDLTLQKRWQLAVDEGYFRYRLNILDTKRLPGKYLFLAQLNPDRATNRRPPEDIKSLTQAFDHQKFNFTKIPESEILFELKGKELLETEPRSSVKDILAINISPLEFGHSLFLPEVSSCLPQILTLYGIQRTLELVLLSKSPALRAGFNSLCGFATVNHLHFHLYYLNYDMLLENIEVQHLSGECHVLTQYAAKGFAFQLNNNHDIFKLASSVYKLTSYLQEHNVAHNVYITRGCYFNTKNNTLKWDTIRVYVWARTHCSEKQNIRGCDPAICELFGHIVIKIPEPFDSLTEDEVVAELKTICEEPFNLVLDDVKVLFQDQSTN